MRRIHSAQAMSVNRSPMWANSQSTMAVGSTGVAVEQQVLRAEIAVHQHLAARAAAEPGTSVDVDAQQPARRLAHHVQHLLGALSNRS